MPLLTRYGVEVGKQAEAESEAVHEGATVFLNIAQIYNGTGTGFV